MTARLTRWLTTLDNFETKMAQLPSVRRYGRLTRATGLVLEATGVAEAQMPPAIASYKLSPEDQKLSQAEKLATARVIMFDDKYEAAKASIAKPTIEFESLLKERVTGDVKAARNSTRTAILSLVVLAFVVPAIAFAVLWTFHIKVSRPVSSYTNKLAARSGVTGEFALEPSGTVELQELAGAFNGLMADNRKQANENAALMADMSKLVASIAEERRTMNLADTGSSPTPIKDPSLRSG